MDGEARYHLELDGRREGPFTRAEVLSLWRRGQVDGTTPFWQKGMDDWARLAAVREEIATGEQSPPSGPPERATGVVVKASDQPVAASGTSLRRRATTSLRAAEDIDWYPSPKKRLVALMLLFLLGWAGVHYLYAERTGRFWGLMSILGLGLLAVLVHAGLGQVGRTEVLRYLLMLLGYLAVIAFYTLLLVDLVQILGGSFRDGDGHALSRWT